MRDLGKIQAKIMDRIRAASAEGDGQVLGLFGPVAAEMDRKGAEWESCLNLPIKASPNGAPLGNNGSLGVPASGAKLAGRDIYGVTILGNEVSVGAYIQAFFAVVERLRAAHPDFDTVAPRVRGHGPYFSANGSDLRKPQRVKNSSLFVETNLGADLIFDICRRLVAAFGHNPDDPSVLRFQVAAERTRPVNRRS
jgi:hypothetical protein